MARLPKEIDWKVVERLVECGCSGVEIARKCDIRKQTFYSRFEQQYKEKFQDYRTELESGGTADLRAMMHAKAMNNKAPGNTNMLIFLAKCRLGMREPEAIRDQSPIQNQIDQSHLIMELQHKIAELEANANKSKTE